MILTNISRIFFEMPDDYSKHELFKKNNDEYRLVSETTLGYLYEKETVCRLGGDDERTN